MDATRERILAAVRADPGVHVARLALLVGLGHTACRHHVRRLEREGVLRTGVQGRRLSCWPTALPPAHRRWVALLREPLPRSVAQALLHAPGVPRARLAQEVGAPAAALHRHLGLLEAAGLVHRLGEDGRTLLFAAEPLADALAAAAAAAPEVQATGGTP